MFPLPTPHPFRLTNSLPDEKRKYIAKPHALPEAGLILFDERKRKMFKKLKRISKRAAAFTLSILTMFTTIASSAATVYAADGTLNFTAGSVK